MFEKSDDPVAWALFIYELSDAHEHLGELIEQLTSRPLDADELRIHLGHVYAHLNRAWYQSKSASEISAAEWDAASAFPQDVTPVG